MKLKLEKINKIYDNGVEANRDINFQVEKGQIHALLGENGAGKTTLMKILSGELRASSGHIYIDDILIDKRQDLLKEVGMIHQHFELIEEYDVAENIMFGKMPVKAGFLLDKKAMYKEIEEFLTSNDIDLQARDKVGELSLAKRCKVEISKVLHKGAKIIIFDEPTTSFNELEKDELFQQFNMLASKGYAIIFITHKLDEVKKVAHKISLIKNGENIGSFYAASKTIAQISSMMFGDIEPKSVEKIDLSGQELFKIENLSINQGEFISLIGLDKKGYEHVLSKILYQCDKNKLKVAYIPENRMSDGLVLDMTIRENLINLKDKKRFGKIFIDRKKLDIYADEKISEYEIKCKNSKQKVKELSGGNMQKILVARELSYRTDVVIAVYPDRGLDIKTSIFIRNKLLEKVNKGTCVILISSDLEESIKISDKLGVILDGKINYVVENPDMKDIIDIKNKMIRK